MSRAPDAQYRWFVGLSEREALSEAVDRLERSSGFVIEHWGVVDAGPGDHDLALRLEVGDRALANAERENEGTALERADHVIEQAIRARPLSLLDLLGADLRRSERGSAAD